MSNRTICCTYPGCDQAATYKIAAAWSDGRFRELKTYGLACLDHLGEIFHAAEERWEETPKAAGEVIDEVGIYRIRPGLRDAFLERLWGLEESYWATSER